MMPRCRARAATRDFALMLVLCCAAAGPGCRRRVADHGARAPARPEAAPPAPSAATLAARLLERAETAALALDAARAPEPGAARVERPLRVALEAEPPHLLPLVENDAALWQVTDRLLFEPLYDCSQGEPLAPAPLLAAGAPTPAGDLALAIALRPGVRLHDGRRLTALDVQASYESVLRQGTAQPVLRQLLQDVALVEVRGEGQLLFRLARPSRLVLRALCEVPVLPEGALRGSAAERAAQQRQPSGTGPFRLAAWERGRRIRLVRNDDYHGAPAHLPGIDFEIETDGARALTGVKRGRLDVLPRVLEVHFPEQVEAIVRTGGLRLVRLPSEQISFLALNVRNEPLSDVRFRQALSRLWDRARMARELHHGLVTPLVGPDPPGPSGLDFDRGEALALLERAGYVDGDDDGVRDLGGRPLRLRLLHATGSKQAAREAHLYALELRRAGILLDVQAVDPSALLSRLQSGDFDLAPLTWEGRPLEDPRLLFGASSPFNAGGYRSVHLAALLDELVAPDGPPFAEQLARVRAHLATEVPVVFLYRHELLALVNPALRGLRAEGRLLDLRRAWLEAGP